MPETDRLVLWGLLTLALLISIVTDLATRRIPDWVTFSTGLIALGYRAFAGGLGDLDHGFVSGLIAGVGAAALMSVWAFRDRVGWGDVKLLFAVGAVFGYPLILSALLFTSLAGALQAIVTLIWKGSVWTTLRGALLRVGDRFNLTKRETTSAESHYIPYGVAIALGSFWAMWWQSSNP